MNTLDDHDATSDALRGLGTRLRSDAEHRPPDLVGLGDRIHAERRRARLVLVTGAAAVVLALVAALGFRGGGTDSLEVVDDSIVSTSIVAPEATMWTVNPSIPADPALGEVWAVDVVYDPAAWNYETLIHSPALDMMTNYQSGGTFAFGMASYKGEPRLQAYWQGPDARQAAEQARDALADMPGVVTVEVGRAEPTSRPPGTSEVVPVVPPTS